MTELSTEDFEDAGRNDPCPCGSGKKFKKCHQRTLRLKKEAEKKTRGVEDLVTAQTRPYEIFKLLGQIRENNAVNLYWEFGHEHGPFRESFKSRDDLMMSVEAGEERLPGSKEYDLRRIRIDGPDVSLLLARGIDDPKLQSVHFDVVTLRPNEIDGERNFREVENRGFRIWAVERFEKPKSELDELDLTHADLGYEWNDAWDRPAELDVIEDADDAADVEESEESEEAAADA